MVLICQGDITDRDTDAIVNASNTRLLPGAGVCGAIYAKAGFSKLMEATSRIPVPLKVGQAVLTPGFDLKARYIIHTAGPVFVDGNHEEASLLARCYENAIRLAKENELSSVTFPLIAAGIFGYPKKEAIAIALKTMIDNAPEEDFKAYLILYKDEDFAQAKEILEENPAWPVVLSD